MSPTRTSRDGCYRLDWTRRGVGRIARSSGAKTVKGWRAAMALCDALYERGEHDVLRALRAGQVTMSEITAAEKARVFSLGGDHLRALIVRRPFWPEIDRWLPPEESLDVTRDRYRVSLKKLKALNVLTKDATVQDLANVQWVALRASGAFKSHSDWNALRRAVSRALTILLGSEQHPVRLAIMDSIPMAPVRARKVKLTAAQFWALVNKAPEVIRAGVVTLGVTGMRLAEYQRARPEHLTALADGSLELAVQGSKNEGATATVLVASSLARWVRAGVPMPLSRQWFRRYFHQARAAIGRTDLTLHDLRHVTATLALEGGAPVNAVRELMRHESTGQTLDYARSGNLGVAAAAIARALTLVPDVPAKKKRVRSAS